MPKTSSAPQWPLWTSLALFFGSGFSALIYEIVWFQLLELVVGSSAISLGILLGTYMAGLCLGSLLLPRIISRDLHPFRVYALLELAIAVLGMLVLLEVPLVRNLYTGSGVHGPFGVVLRAAIAGLCLLPPTILMGATLPAMARWVEAEPDGAGWLGRLYASNIAGGIAGCLVAGFYLLRWRDIGTATAVAVLANLVVGAAGLLIARRTAKAPAPPSPARPIFGRPSWIYVAIACSGLSALAGEVVWTRTLSLLLGPTVYTFSIILAVFLFGLGLGSAIGSSLARWSMRPARDLGIVQTLLAAAIAWTAFAVARSLPYWPIAPTLARSPWISFQLDLVRCMWAILLPTLLWGMSFPFALAAAAKPGEDPAQWVSGIYAANTIGAIVGALAFTFWIIPAWGTHVAQQLMIALAAAPGLGLAAVSSLQVATKTGRAIRGLALAGAGALSLVFLLAVPAIPSDLIALGRYAAYGLSHASGDPSHDPHILYVGEGLTESVAVSENGPIRLFHVSGKVEAGTSLDDMRLQRMLGALPAVFHPAPRTALVVGCGAGVTAGSLVVQPSMEHMVICEIEALVIKKVAPFFARENFGVVSDPKVTIVYDDARHYILTTKQKFDIITSDPIHPWVRGSATLYSRDYFELVKRHLNPGGVVSQWVPIYETSETTVKGEIATFFSVFPQGTLWANRNAAGGYDLVMIGTDGPAAIDLGALEARWRQPEFAPVTQSLQAIGFASPFDLLGTYAGRNADLGPWLAGVPLDLDLRPWLQYQAGLDTYVEQRGDVLASISAYRKFPEDLFVGSDSLKERVKVAGSGRAVGPG